MKSDKDRLENELSTLASLNRFMFAPPQPVSVEAPPSIPPRSKSPVTFTSKTTILTGDHQKKDRKAKRPFTIESLISDDRSSDCEYIFLNYFSYLNNILFVTF